MQRHSSALLVGIPGYVVTIAAGAVLLMLGENQLLGTTTTFVALSALLSGYVVFELVRLWRRDRRLFLANPVALCSIFTVMMSFGATNFLYFLPDEQLARIGLMGGITPVMNKMILIAGIGSMAMWIGYWTDIGQSACRKLLLNAGLQKLLRPTFRVNLPVVGLLVIVDIVAKLISFKLGVFGYSSDYEALVQYGNVRAYLSAGEAAGKLALMALALAYYSKQDLPHLRTLLIAVLAYEVATGFLSGFKSQVAMPFITVGFCAYLILQRFPRWLVPSIAVALIAAYVVIEPFRQARYDNLSMDNTNAGSVMSTMLDSAGRPSPSHEASGLDIAVSILARGNMTYIASLGVEYKDEGGSLDEAPEFLDDILWSPVYAVVPRLLWESKPFQTLGLWYYRTVMGFDGYTSVGMSAFTYLYFAGGIAAVAIGFLVLGILHGAWREALGAGGGAAFVALGTLTTLTLVESSFDTVFVTLMRFVPALVLVQLVLLRPPARARRALPIRDARPFSA